MTTLRCLVTEDNIAARACVDAQVEQRCWCSKAPLAVVEVAAIALPGSRLGEQIDKCKNTAATMLRKPVGDRYDGPALRKLRGIGTPVEVPLPAPPAVQKAAPVKPAAYAVQGALAAPAKRVVPEPITPAPPAKESSMPRGPSFSEGKKCETCDAPIANINTTGRCKSHKDSKKAKTSSNPAPVVRLPRKPATARLRSLAEVVAKHTPVAQPGDVIQLLEHQLAHHQEQASRCEKALAALRS